MMFSKEDFVISTGAVLLKDNLSESDGFVISTDTRTLKEGDIYLPLKGANFDGEDFIEKALEAGAAGYFTAGDRVFDEAGLVLKVDDTLGAYLKLAKYCREKKNPITVQVTGSSGKTTTKEMIYSVLSAKFKTHKTLSNHNNEIGFCKTVLSMPEDTEVLVVESGMRGLGEIELISKHLMPDIAVITNSGSAHLGRLGSLDNIAKAKCEVLSGLKSDGFFVALNQDIVKKHSNFSGETVYYSLKDVNILENSPGYSKFEYKGEIYELNVEGHYNIENSLSAIEIGLKLGMEPDLIAKGLLTYHPIEKRWEIETVGGFKFINDSYNANPESMKAAVKTFVELYDNPVVVLGDMGELGADEVSCHREVGRYFAGLNKRVKYLTVGNLIRETASELKSAGFDVTSFESTPEVSDYIVENLNESYTIFLKASRSMKFEEILEQVKRGICKL